MEGVSGEPAGIPAGELSDDDLMRELGSVHRTRHVTLRHGSDQALLHHNIRMAELEAEYLRRLPEREVDPRRLADGARALREQSGPRTGAEQPWDPEDVVVAEGRDPTPADVEQARRRLAEEGQSVFDRTVP
jgi:hypothetical protein